MKNRTITFLLSAISFCCFAQTPFTEQTVKDMSDRLIHEPTKFCKEDLAPNFVITGTEGKDFTYDQITKLILESKQISRVLTDVKVKQYGNVATATGSLVHVFQFAGSQTPITSNERFTYIHEFNNGKWQIVHAQHTPILPTNLVNEEAAIKKHLDDVDAAFNNGDKDGVINAWKNDPKISFIGNGAGGEFNLIAQDFVKPTGTKGIKSNHRFIFKGNLAIVEFDQEDIRANGTKGYAHNINILEKEGDSWKAIVASHHSFNKPTNEEKPEEIVKQWIAEYNKDGKSFFEKNCSDDFIASNLGINGGKFFGREAIVSRARKEIETNDVESINMKSFKSGNLAVVMGNLIWHHKQADGTDKPDNTVSTFVMQKREGKWWYVGHHISPFKE
jgi:ketosteroid isomerase-like protein